MLTRDIHPYDYNDTKQAVMKSEPEIQNRKPVRCQCQFAGSKNNNCNGR